MSDFTYYVMKYRPAPGDGAAVSGSSDEIDLVDLFLSQCSMMRHLSELFVSLHSSGHFDFYPQYSYEVPVTSSDSIFRAKVRTSNHFISILRIEF